MVRAARIGYHDDPIIAGKDGGRAPSQVLLFRRALTVLTIFISVSVARVIAYLAEHKTRCEWAVRTNVTVRQSQVLRSRQEDPTPCSSPYENATGSEMRHAYHLRE